MAFQFAIERVKSFLPNILQIKLDVSSILLAFFIFSTKI